MLAKCLISQAEKTHNHHIPKTPSTHTENSLLVKTITPTLRNMMLQTILENIMRYPANLFNRHPSHEEPVLKKKGNDYAVTSTTLIGLQRNFADRSWPPTVYFMAFAKLIQHQSQDFQRPSCKGFANNNGSKNRKAAPPRTLGYHESMFHIWTNHLSMQKL